MADEPRVQELLDEILDSERTPEEVCSACPELLPEVRKRWQQMRIVEAELEALFPTPGPDATASLPQGADLPRISGYEAARRLDEAIEEYRQALRVNPKYAPAHTNLGIALNAQGRLDDAIDHYRQAIRIDPKLAEVHGALGQALLAGGRFRDAQAATRRCLDLLPPDHPLGAGVTQQLQRFGRLLTLEPRLPAVLEGKDKPADAAECLDFAELCHIKKQYAAAARLFIDAFAAKPQLADDVQAARRYNAACSATLAGCGRGENGSSLGDTERARWCEQARAWLHADLAVWAKKVDSGAAADRVLVRKRLTPWRADPDLAGLREPSALDKLSADERKECVALWNEVGAVLTRARKTK